MEHFNAFEVVHILYKGAFTKVVVSSALRGHEGDKQVETKYERARIIASFGGRSSSSLAIPPSPPHGAHSVPTAPATQWHSALSSGPLRWAKSGHGSGSHSPSQCPPSAEPRGESAPTGGGREGTTTKDTIEY